MRRALGAAVLAVTVGGCAWLPPTRATPAASALAIADDLARAGAWEDAVSAYGRYLARYPDADETPRAAASRDTLRALLAARAEGARLREEVTRLRDELARRDTDLVRLRHEAERLRADLEKLKQIDFKLERRK